MRGEVLLSHFGQQAITNGELKVTLESISNPGEILQSWSEADIHQNLGTLARRTELDWPLPDVTAPKPLLVRTRLRTAQGEFENEWPVWLVPVPSAGSQAGVRLHSSVSDKLASELFPGVPRLKEKESGSVIVAARLDSELCERLEDGAHVLLLPDGQKGSFPLNSHWFLQGAPYIPDHPFSRKIPRDLLLDLQNFDLAGEVVPDINYIENIDPVLMLWATHDVKTIKTHGLIFETRIAKQGRLLVSALNHGGPDNAAGRWLLGLMLDDLKSPATPRNALSEETWASMKKQLVAESTNLAACTWRFRPDPKNEGLSQGWHQAKLAVEDGWKDIRIGATWESQGYPDLDGWAWYRLAIEIPARWKGREVSLSFQGVDDLYELYVNGELVGKSGDLATRKDAYSEKKSYDITRLVKAGESATMAVRVQDWGGAGGIFCPMTLGTVGISSGTTILK